MDMLMMYVVAALLFILLPFLLSVVLPSVVIPLLVKLIIARKNFTKIPSIKPFILFLILGGLIASALWFFLLQDRVYHVSDSLSFVGYSFFGFERPSFVLGNGWLAKGWKIWHLDLLWAALTISVYICAAFLTWYKNKKSPLTKEYEKTLVLSVLVLIMVTIVSPKIKFFNFKWVPILTNSKSNSFQEKNISCPKSTARQPGILYWYNAENGEVVQNLDGSNQTVAFEKDVQLRSRSAIFSPDETKVVALQIGWNEYWIMCTYSRGATKITLPELKKNQSEKPRSAPSWSPDGEKLVVFLYGDLAVIDISTKKIETIKTNIAFRDNHVDLTSKDRNLKIPAYEGGSVYWARDGKIYYSSYQSDKHVLHKYDVSDQSDHVISAYNINENISILSGDPTGRYLLINVFRVNNDRSFYDFGRNVIFDTKINKEIEQYDGNSIATIVWSPSGKYFAQSIISWNGPNGEISIPATYIFSVNHTQDINISAQVEDYFIQAGKSFTPGSLAVEVKDFINDDQVLLHVTFSGITSDHSHAFANLIVNFHTKEVKLLQDYLRGQDTGKELFPIKILHP